MFSPPRMMRSFIRSTMNRCPSVSIYATSPVLNQPSSANESAVASGLFQYSRNIDGPRTCSSPRSPGCSSFPSSSTTRKSITHNAGPELKRRSEYSAPKIIVPIAFVSVIPQPVFGRAFSNVSSICPTCSGGRAAPPPPTLNSDERSRPSD